MSDPVRVVVTGSRDWPDRKAVYEALDTVKNVRTNMIVVHGACPSGADRMADDWCRNNEVPVERWYANWSKYGMVAGPVRNERMIDAGGNMCIAFIKNGSSGASHTADLAEQAGMVVQRVRR